MNGNQKNSLDAPNNTTPLGNSNAVDSSPHTGDKYSSTTQNETFPRTVVSQSDDESPRIKHEGQTENRNTEGRLGDSSGMSTGRLGLVSADPQDKTQTCPMGNLSTQGSARESEAQRNQALQPRGNGRHPDTKHEADQGRASPLDGYRSPKFGTRPESVFMAPLTHPNGVSIFPNLSAAEQEHLSREALDQAQDAIVAESSDNPDSIGSGPDDDGTDGGYDSDDFSAASTSAESSVRDYMYENGRRYHRFREGSYNFPNDDVEQEREDMKHAMVKLLCSQKLHFAPIGNNPQEILDIGTGTGIWPIEMGDQYPSAHILGIDLSPIQPDWLPPNVRFLVDDVESPWLHPRNNFDYIHSRHTVMAIRDWTKLFRRTREHLKPGGWIELQEIHHSPRSANPQKEMPPDHPVAKFWNNVIEGLGVLGVDLNASAGGRLANMMHEAGFVNVTERVLHVPIGTWPQNKVLKTVGLYWRTILLDGLQAIALGPLTRGLGWNRDEVEVFLMEVRRAYFDNASLMYMPFHIVYAQKPPYEA